MADDMSKMPGSHDRSERPYGFMERELAFKLLAAHAMVDRDFFDWLRNDPIAAAAQLHITLIEDDIAYLNKVDWSRIEKVADEVRESLELELVTNSW